MLKHIKEGIDKLKKVTGGGLHVNAFSLVYEDRVTSLGSQVCCGCLRRTNTTGLVSILSSITDKCNVEDEYFLPYTDWLINRSPYSIAFISDNAEQVKEDRCFIVDPKCPCNILIGGITASRCMWEYTKIAIGWFELTKRGCNENLAFLLAHYTNISDGKVGFKEFTTNHIAVNCTHNLTYTHNFVFNKPRLDPTYLTNPSYNGICSTWYGDEGSYLIKSYIAQIVYSNTVSTNPFAAALGGEDSLTSFEDGFGQLAIMSHEIMEKIS